jgi:2-alkyl-3-oxoalkanoate reductase
MKAPGWPGSEIRYQVRVFVAGATGAIGSRLIKQLAAAGHWVAGMTRSPANAEAIERTGAAVCVADALSRAAIVAAVARARPDVIVHARFGG